jgi:phosphoglycerol transferase MdoB-like AlkP superfamily enzyme
MLSPILSLLLGTSVHRTVARTKRNGIFIALAVILILTAYALAVVAGAIWLAGIYGAIGAALFLAACALLIAIVVLIAMTVLNAQEARRAKERRQAVESLAAAGIGLVRSQPLLTVGILVALVASNLLGSRSSD